ncbi:AGE family epimerase/isomerase [Evansella cellulosilytica]|uniref:Cellobiose 2-epimerase n=1 Tax=Evansella cellulosilytica (strain ATCC 21833 / DSM 2522 / FERM P-1141 / JCM 9156 / N-4) TaxID=649639 RepID=E6TUY1_EVAC2|nr:AGE family epimerase/isomerase [Evansella cellulosilytica]ADU28564.1 N-acylglucosamine 2-epimerase [Evansella cellulosilytica DSM 2522]
MDKTLLYRAKQEIEKELTDRILPFWKKRVIDGSGDGFHGYIDYHLTIDHDSEKGCILHSRILWSFSAAYRKYKNDTDLQVATRAFNYLKNYLIDDEFGGLYWSVTNEGELNDTRKHIYNQAFGIYGLVEYFRATNNEEALQLAKEIYQLIEMHGFDEENKGYLEAFSRQWEKDEDLRLSDKDMDVEKTMNTHLHILEAYTNLYRVWKDDVFKEKFELLFDVVAEKVLNEKTGHYSLFFDAGWKKESDVISYGHDIEGSWLMTEAAEVLGCKVRQNKMKTMAIKMVDACIEEGLENDGSLINEKDSNDVDATRVWWVQAESLVGFLNAYELSGEERYLKHFHNSWEYIKKYVIDDKHGEWYWELDQDNNVNKEKPIVEPWKGPYHNSRACMEAVERITKITNNYIDR